MQSGSSARTLFAGQGPDRPGGRRAPQPAVCAEAALSRAVFLRDCMEVLGGRKIQARATPLAHDGTCVVVISRNPSGTRGISSIEQQSKEWRAPAGSNRVP